MIGQTNAVEDINIKSSINYIEYIESTKTQYIDTGFINLSSKQRIVLSASIVNASAWTALMGNRITYNSNQDVCLSYYPTQNKMYLLFGNKEYSSGAIYSSSITLGSKLNFDITYDPNTKTMFGVFNGTNFSKSVTDTISLTYTKYLFAINQQGNAVDKNGQIRIYNCQIYSDDVLVRDFRPALDENNVACLYDEVSKTYFYNAGTGTFNAGAII